MKDFTQLLQQIPAEAQTMVWNLINGTTSISNLTRNRNNYKKQGKNEKFIITGLAIDFYKSIQKLDEQHYINLGIKEKPSTRGIQQAQQSIKDRTK